MSGECLPRGSYESPVVSVERVNVEDKTPLLKRLLRPFSLKRKQRFFASPDKPTTKPKKINMWRLVALAFVFTCSGPFGVEAAFRAGGPALGLLGLLFMPLFFVVPQIVMVAELATMIPSNHGYVAWVTRGLGDFLGFINAFSTLSANLVCMSVYCSLFSSYICACHVLPFGTKASFKVKYAIRFVGNLCATLLALLPSSRVAEISTVIGSVVMTPFVIGFALSVPSIRPAEQWMVWQPIGSAFEGSNAEGTANTLREGFQQNFGAKPIENVRFFPLEDAKQVKAVKSLQKSSKTSKVFKKSQYTQKIDWPLWGSTLCWLYTGWNSLGNLAAEVHSTSTYTYGMITAMGLDIAAYLVSVIAALTVPAQRAHYGPETQLAPWDDGYLVPAFEAILPGLGTVIAVVSALSIFGIIINSITCYGRAAAGMAELGWFPKIFAQTYKFVPTNAIGLFFVLTAVLSVFDFDVLIQFNFVLAAQGYILTFIAFLRLKYIEKDTPRPYVVPFGMVGAWATTVSKMALMLFVMGAIFAHHPHVLLFYVGYNVFLSIVYLIVAK